MLTRRVLRDAQVRSLYSPPSRESGGRSHRDRSDIPDGQRWPNAAAAPSSSIAAVPFLRAWRSGLRACLPNRRCPVRSRPPAPTCHRLPPRGCQGYGAFNAGLHGLNSRWRDQFIAKFTAKRTGASPSWPRRRILIPVTAGSSPAALTNSSRGLGREGAGSHKAGVAGSTPVPATISCRRSRDR